MKVSVVIPAYNEEKYLPRTLEALVGAIPQEMGPEIVVVDNESSDQTAAIAADFGALVVSESVHNIGRVRNTGAMASTGEIIVFLDADTLVSPGLFESIENAMADDSCLGGSAAVEYETRFRRLPVRFFMHLWVFLGRYTNMRQGALQFCRRTAFAALGGYDPTIYMGEDIEFHWRLEKLARKSGGHTEFIAEKLVRTSSRRWDKMGLVRMIFFTHPVTMFLAWRHRPFWKDWYENAIR